MKMAFLRSNAPGGRIEHPMALIAVVAVPHQSSFSRLELKLFGLRLDVHEGAGTDDLKKSQIWLRPV